MKKRFIAGIVILLAFAVLLSGRVGCAEKEIKSQPSHPLEITLTSENEWGYNQIVYPADYGIIEIREHSQKYALRLYDSVWVNESESFVERMAFLIEITDVDDTNYLCDVLTIGDARDKFNIEVQRHPYYGIRGFIVSRDSMAFRGRLATETAEQWLEVGESIILQLNQQINK